MEPRYLLGALTEHYWRARLMESLIRHRRSVAFELAAEYPKEFAHGAGRAQESECIPVLRRLVRTVWTMPVFCLSARSPLDGWARHRKCGGSRRWLKRGLSPPNHDLFRVEYRRCVSGRQKPERVRPSRLRRSSIERDQSSTVALREPQQISIADLFRSSGRSHVSHGCG